MVLQTITQEFPIDYPTENFLLTTRGKVFKFISQIHSNAKDSVNKLNLSLCALLYVCKYSFNKLAVDRNNFFLGYLCSLIYNDMSTRSMIYKQKNKNISPCMRSVSTLQKSRR